MRFRYSPGFLPGLRRHIPLIIAAILGLTVALVSGKYMLTYVNTHKETVRVPVPAREIAPYTTIIPDDIIWREIIKGGEDPSAVHEPSEVVGKLVLTPLYRNEQIRKERLLDPKLVANKQIISLNIDVARSVGGSLRAGDLVDVWWVVDPAFPNWSLAAVDAVVMDIRDSAGRLVSPTGGGVTQQALEAAVPSQPSPPAVAVLAVRSEDVMKVVGGASPKSQNVVLSKKFVPGPPPLAVPLAGVQTSPDQKNQGIKVVAPKTTNFQGR